MIWTIRYVGQILSANRCCQTRVRFGDWSGMSNRGSHIAWELQYEATMMQLPLGCNFRQLTIKFNAKDSSRDQGVFLLWVGLDVKSGAVKAGPTIQVTPALYWHLSNDRTNNAPVIEVTMLPYNAPMIVVTRFHDRTNNAHCLICWLGR